MKKEPGGTLGKKSSHKCVQELCIHPSLKPIPCTGQGEPRWRTALACCCVLVPVPPVPSHGDSSALSAQSRADAKLSTAPETEVPAQHPLSPPHLAPTRASLFILWFAECSPGWQIPAGSRALSQTHKGLVYCLPNPRAFWDSHPKATDQIPQKPFSPGPGVVVPP